MTVKFDTETKAANAVRVAWPIRRTRMLRLFSLVLSALAALVAVELAMVQPSASAASLTPINGAG